MNLWRLAFAALVSALAGLALGAGAVYVARRAPTDAPGPLAVTAPVELALLPKTPPRWPRWRAAIMRFLKVLCFVALGFIAASVTSPDGLRAILDPINGAVMFIASLAGAVLKYVQWKDIDAEAPPMVTLALAPAVAPVEPPAPPIMEGE